MIIMNTFVLWSSLVINIACMSLLSGCQAVATDDSFQNEFVCSCQAMSFPRGSSSDHWFRIWYANKSEGDEADLLFVEWRFLEAADTIERFFALANDFAPAHRRRKYSNRFNSYEELTNAVVSLLRDNPFNADLPLRENSEVSVLMFQKFGFPENSGLDFDLYCRDQSSRRLKFLKEAVKKYSDDDVVEAIPGFIQYYSGCGIESNTISSIEVRVGGRK